MLPTFGIMCKCLTDYSDQLPTSYSPEESRFKFGKFIQLSVHYSSMRCISSCKSVDDRPTLPTLRDFPGKGRSIDIAAQIGTDYSMLGTLILEDNNGKKVDNIKKAKLGDPVDTAVAILKMWVEGKGKTPVTWQTLVTCLRKTGLNVLADDIETVLSEHIDRKNPDQKYL